jgi:hypothetical protein
MSRNLGMTNCYLCKCTVAIAGPVAQITEAQAGRYFPEYIGMAVADAICTACGAKYLAWVTPPSRWGSLGRPPDPEVGFVDLSFRGSFNDEPADEDLPSVAHLRLYLRETAEKLAGLARALDWVEGWKR